MSQAILNPFTPYLGTDGQPLQNGKLYVGVAGNIAETAPLTVYWDRALTQPAAQPLTLQNGFITFSGGPANVFFSASDYSLTLKDHNDVNVFSILSAQAGGFTDQVISVPTIPVSNDNLIQNSNFEYNQLGVSGTVTLSANQAGHDWWYAGSGGCTYTFTTSLGVTTVTIVSGTLYTQVPGFRAFSQTYWLSWNGTAQGRVGAGVYGTPRAVTLVGGVTINIEFSAGTLSQVQLIVSSSTIAWKSGNNIYRAEMGIQSSNRNLIINSGFTVNQGGLNMVGAAVTLGATAVANDVWRAGAAGVTYQIIPSLSLSRNGINITAGSLTQTVESWEEIKISGNYVLSWSGTASCKIYGTTFTNGYAFISMNYYTNVVLEWLPGTMWNPTLTLGDNIVPYVPELQVVELLRCYRHRQSVTFSEQVYGSAGMDSIRYRNLPVPLRSASPTLTILTGPTYVNASAFNVLPSTQYIKEDFIVTALGVARATATYMLDATI